MSLNSVRWHWRRMHLLLLLHMSRIGTVSNAVLLRSLGWSLHFGQFYLCQLKPSEPADSAFLLPCQTCDFAVDAVVHTGHRASHFVLPCCREAHEPLDWCTADHRQVPPSCSRFALDLKKLFNAIMSKKLTVSADVHVPARCHAAHLGILEVSRLHEGNGTLVRDGSLRHEKTTAGWSIHGPHEARILHTHSGLTND